MFRWPVPVTVVEHYTDAKVKEQQSNQSKHRCLTVITALRCTKCCPMSQNKKGQTPVGWMTHSDVMKILTLCLIWVNMMTP